MGSDQQEDHQGSRAGRPRRLSHCQPDTSLHPDHIIILAINNESASMENDLLSRKLFNKRLLQNSCRFKGYLTLFSGPQHSTYCFWCSGKCWCWRARPRKWGYGGAKEARGLQPADRGWLPGPETPPVKKPVFVVEGPRLFIISGPGKNWWWPRSLGWLSPAPVESRSVFIAREGGDSGSSLH